MRRKTAKTKNSKLKAPNSKFRIQNSEFKIPSPRLNVVFVVAHPDDVAFTFGGTAWLLHERYKLHVFCASQGERGYVWKGPGPKPPSPQVAATRAKEEAVACALLGAELTFLGQMDGEIYAGREVCAHVAGLLAPLKPAALFTHNPLEKADHAATYGIATRALHLADLFWTTELYLPVEYGSIYNAKSPDVWVNISSVVEQKRRLVYCHASHAKSGMGPPSSRGQQSGQRNHPSQEQQAVRGLEMFIERNRLLGRLAWCDYAEAYWTGLALTAERWQRKAGSILMELPVVSA